MFQRDVQGIHVAAFALAVVAAAAAAVRFAAAGDVAAARAVAAVHGAAAARRSSAWAQGWQLLLRTILTVQRILAYTELGFCWTAQAWENTSARDRPPLSLLRASSRPGDSAPAP